MVRWRGLVFVGGLMSLLSGCGDGLSVAEVEGVVTVGGKPMEQIQVEFVPLGTGIPSVGITDASGRYSLTTNDGKQKGAFVGSHRVAVRDAAVLGNQFLGRAGEDVDMSQGRKTRISLAYADAQRSPLTKDVEAGKKNDIALEVEPAKK